MKKIFLLFITFACIISAQTSSNNSEEIYKKLLETINPQKVNEEKWVINDAEIIIQLYRLLVPGGREEEKIINRQVEIEIEMGDGNEIRNLSFQGLETKLQFSDFQELKYQLGSAYDLLKNKKYQYYDVSTIAAPSKKRVEYLLNLNILNPSILISQFSNTNKNITLSLIGKWGEDNIINPGWFSNEYMIGAKLASYGKETLKLRSIERPEWAIEIGATIKKKHMLTGNLPLDPVRFAGEGFHLRLSGKPNDLWNLTNSAFFKNFEIQFLGKFNYATSECKDFDIYSLSNIVANKNYFGLQLINYQQGRIIDFGELKYRIGLMFYDIHQLQIDPINNQVKDLLAPKSKKDRYRGIISASIGLEKLSSYWQHDFSILLTYEPSFKYGYIGFLFNFMVNDTFGFDIRYFRTFTGPIPIPSWRTDEYFVFSPIIRIGN